ncbi:FG-GAP repeat domain-containing protein [Actinoplanes subglobosus]|uniref:FG-GAP repeat domain-containing protein n=1 Tax=Actinoplanes subglobosus TaxID=1547892 RepID=A0ABV8IX80_9ACTN
MTVAAAACWCAPAAAQAAPAESGAGAQAPCLPGAVTSDDHAVASQLRPAMNGRRLGGSVNGRSIACARAIVAAVKARGLAPRAAVIAVTTAIAESTLHNHAVVYDHDSLGLFQQRPSQGWGRPDQLLDVEYATNAFLSSMLRKYPGDTWMRGDIGAICQRVQRSAYPAAYSPEAHDAELIVAQLWDRPAAPGLSSAPAAATGPFQRALIAAGTQLGTLEGRHEVALTDWNGDGRPDLLVVKGSPTVTGRTEVRIMDGATDFTSLLLDRPTALGATDDRHAYSFADWNGDKRPDLVVVQRSGTASGKAEISVLDGATAYRQVLLQTATALPATDGNHRFTATDWNGDNRPDLVVTRVSGAAGGRMEVQVLDGASTFQKHLLPVTVTAEPASTDHRVIVTDLNNDRHPDLVVVEESGTVEGKTRLRALDGASNLQRKLLEADTAPGATTHLDMLITDWNDDKRPDLMMIQKTGTASGRSELVILDGR